MAEINFTDPVVHLDPKFQQTPVAKLWQVGSSDESDGDGIMPHGISSTLVDGIEVPVLKINNRVIDENDISSIKLYYNGFLPSIDISIYDTMGMAKFSDTPGYNNTITLILTMPGGVTNDKPIYKKISLDFYITDYSPTDGMIFYSGEFKLMPLEQIKTEQIKCSNPDNPDPKPSTWSMLWEIANRTKLGFASTDDCKNIKDNRYRICSSQKLREFIPDAVSYGGLDENSYFDCWVDLFGYLVLVNVSWLFNINIKEEELEIKVNINQRTEQSNGPKTEWKSVVRTITNYDGISDTASNLIIDSFEELSDTGGVYESGASRHYNSFSLCGGQSDVTSLNSFDVGLREKSPEAEASQDEYKAFERWFFPGVEMSDELPVIKQRTTRNDFFARKRSRMLKVTMRTPNYGLQRGTLLNVGLVEYDNSKQAKLLRMYDNMRKDQVESEVYTKETEDSIKQQLTENNSADSPIPNFMLSGMYYIDGMEFNYDGDEVKMVQTLYLIRKNDSIIYTPDSPFNLYKFRNNEVN